MAPIRSTTTCSPKQITHSDFHMTAQSPVTLKICFAFCTFAPGRVTHLHHQDRANELCLQCLKQHCMLG